MGSMSQRDQWRRSRSCAMENMTQGTHLHNGHQRCCLQWLDLCFVLCCSSSRMEYYLTFLSKSGLEPPKMRGKTLFIVPPRGEPEYWPFVQAATHSVLMG